MAHQYAQIAFTDSVREVQQHLGSRAGYAGFDQGEDTNYLLSEREAEFISTRDSFYMASVSETGWPYLQHRGGPVGFIRVIDAQTLGFADFSGNRQYISVGNLRKDDRVSLFFMDYPNRTRLKILARVRLIGDDELEMLAKLESPDYRAQVERGFLIHIEAFDWNCPQHITPRYTDADIDRLISPLQQELANLKNSDTAVQANELGDGPLPLVISGVRQLASGIRAYELRDPDGADLPPVEAGAHLQIPVRIGDNAIEERHYSIASNPRRRDIYEIAVLRKDNGTGGSRAVHDSFTLGTRLNCQPPQNKFRLHDDERPAVLIAGGIGITPIKPMAQALQDGRQKFEMHYAARNPAAMAYGDRLQCEFGGILNTYFSELGDHMDIQRILRTAPANALFYICGPAGLIDAVVEHARQLGIDPERIRYERFVATNHVDAKLFQLELKRSGIQVDVAAGESMLDAILEAGINVPFSCRTGICKTCAVRVLDGEAEHRDEALSPTEREQHGMICPCVSRASSERLVIDL